MLQDLLIWFFGAAVFLWSFRVIYVLWGCRRENSKPNAVLDEEDLPFVTLIVPARNEEQNIDQCLESLIRCNYPNERYEIICVDDCSEDMTHEKLEYYSLHYPNVHVIRLGPEKKSAELHGKTAALQAAFDIAKGEYVLMTDADCIVHEQWIREYVSAFKGTDPGLIAGITRIQYHNFFSKVQALEWIYMSKMAAAGVGWNTPLGCYGNNYGIKKSLLDEIGGYRNIKFSVTEDLMLMLEAHRVSGNTRYLTSPEVRVLTKPVKDLGTYFNQHHRWTNGGKALGLKAFVFVLCSSSLWLAFLLSLIALNPLYMGLVLLLRILGDFLVLLFPLIKHKESKLFLYIVPAILFFLVVELIAPLMLLFKKVEWKGRVFDME
jgi:cellulose synthase/poly-beta-1,6-N-acetylglucosamine synthase-like glycosyltransferase